VFAAAAVGDGYVRETSTLPREEARARARLWLDRWPAAAGLHVRGRMVAGAARGPYRFSDEKIMKRRLMAELRGAL